MIKKIIQKYNKNKKMPPKHKKVPPKTRSLNKRSLMSKPAPRRQVSSVYPYREFLNKFVVGKAPASLSKATVDTWPDTTLQTDTDKITDEVAKKFLDINKPGSNGLGIGEFIKSKGSGAHQYGMNKKYLGNNTANSTFLQLNTDPRYLNHEGVRHELTHTNDHQKDNLNAKVWKHLETLHNAVGYQQFPNSMIRIQDKIDPSQIFSSGYRPTRDDLIKEIVYWNRGNNTTYSLPSRKINKNDWAPVFPDIQQVVTDPRGRVPNEQFLLNYGSEYPAFMMQNLTNHWRAGKNIPDPNNPGHKIPNPNNSLTNDEIKFVDSVLRDIEVAYPAQDYPTINKYARERRNSVNYKKGGHVKNYAGRGYVSGNSSYDPYLNTYNYTLPLRLSEYLTDQMPDYGYDETESYNDPYMPYSNAYDDDGQQYSFKDGGSVQERELPKLADLIRRHGRNGDTELAHINPIEAHILKSLGGSGTINPATGLREYSFWKKPWKAIRSVIGGGAGAVIGNMIAPGIGGIIGGALGQGVQHAARGKSALSGALKGAGMGAALPSVASGLGWGASKLGASALGSSLSNYGTTNAILPALGMGSSSGSSGLLPLGGSNPYVSGGLSAATALSSGMGGTPSGYGQYPQMQYPGYPYVDNRGFLEKFGDNAKDYLTQPGNLLTLGTVAAQYAGRQKPKSPEKIAEEERRYRNASRKTIAEVEADEALETARADLQKKRKNKQLEEDIKNMGSVRRRVVSPEEFARTGRWLEYTDEEGRPLRMKGGGSAHSPYAYLTEETYYPASPIGYLSGDSGGQDDLIDAKLSDGEYVFDASTVSDLGDGNNAAGARKLDMFRENIRKHKRGGKVMLPPRSKSLESYLRG